MHCEIDHLAIPQVNSKHNAGVSICGYARSAGVKLLSLLLLRLLDNLSTRFMVCRYLSKYRPFAPGLLSQTWEPRFFTLNGTALQVGISHASALPECIW